MENNQTPMPLIYQRMANILADCSHISKDRKNVQQGYSFRGIDDSYNMLHDHFAKHQVFVMPEVLDERREERPTKTGGVMTYTILRVKFRFITVDGSSTECITVGEASDSGDKSTNKSMSTAMKYALFMVFLIPTEGDNDTENHSPEFAAKNNQQPAPQPEIDYAALDKKVSEDIKALVTAKEINAKIEQLKRDGLYDRYGDWVKVKASSTGLVWSDTFNSYGEPVPPTEEEIKKATNDLIDCKSEEDIKSLAKQLPVVVRRDPRFQDAAKKRRDEIVKALELQSA